MLRPKDNRAFIFYAVAVLMLWQFGATIGDLCTDTYAQISTQESVILSLVFAKNTGGAFSLFEGHPYLLATFGIIVLGAISAYVFKKITFDDKFKILALTLFSAGILGNLYERITLGYVIDYIKLNFINFAVFNAYDVMISLSVVLFLAVLFYEDIIIARIKNGKKGS